MSSTDRPDPHPYLPHQLDRLILKLLANHTGRARAVSLPALVDDLLAHGQRVNTGLVRLSIALLRKDGEPVCSYNDETRGECYYLAASWQELSEFTASALHTRAVEMVEQEIAMTALAKRKWGAQYKPGTKVRLP